MSAFSPASILYASSGTAIAALTTAPVGTELALIVRNIPSGTQTISGTVAQGVGSSLANAWTVRLTDGTNAPTIDNVDPAINEWGLTVRNIPSGTQNVVLQNDTLNTNFEVGYGAALKTMIGIVGGSDYSGGLPSGGAGYPLRVDTNGRLSMTLGPPTGGAANYVYARPTDGTNSITLLNSYPTGLEYALPVRSVDGFLGKVDPGNSTSTPLGANATFLGTALDCLPYASIAWSIATDVISTVNGVEAQFSPDGVNWDTRLANSVSSDRIGPGKVTDLAIRPHDRYFRIKYTNGATPQSYFRLQVVASKSTTMGDTIGVDHPPASGDDAALVKAVLSGRVPPSESIGGTPSYHDVAVDANGNMFVTESGTHAAFGSMLVATEDIKINLQFPYAINNRLVKTTTANGGTVTQSVGRAMLQTSAANNGSAKMESIDTIKYTPGQGIICRFTAVFTTGVANSLQEVGIGDDSDGYFFGFNGTSFGINRRVGGVDNWVPQASWNGDDKFDGTGASGHTLDPTKGYPYQIQFQWLGFGAIRYFIEAPGTGDFVLVHTIKYAGTNTVPSVNNPTLPLHAKVINIGNTSNLTLYTPSMGALTEGLSDDVGSNVRWAFTNYRPTVATTGTAFFSLQNKTNNVLGGVNTNRVIMHIDHISLRAASGKDFLVAIYKNATITAPTWVDVDTNTAVSQTDIVGTTTGTGGIAIFYLSVSGNTSDHMDLTSYNIRVHPGETISFVGFGESVAGDGRVSIGWHEEF